MHDANPLLILAILVLAVSAGCAPAGPRTYPVSGKVTLNGQPLEAGMVFFVDPEMKLDSDVGPIANGEFKFKAKPGIKRVELRAERRTGEIGNFGGAISEEALPARYNAESKLTAEVTTSGKDHRYLFELEAD